MKSISDADFMKIKRLLKHLSNYETITDVTKKAEYRRQASLLYKKLESQKTNN